MENDQLIKEVTAKAQVWLGDGYDAETRAEVQRMLDADDKTDLIECFYRDLEFGTGGLRGIMGADQKKIPSMTSHISPIVGQIKHLLLNRFENSLNAGPLPPAGRRKLNPLLPQL